MFPYPLTKTLLLDFLKKEDAQAIFQLISKNRAYLKEFLPWLDFCNSIEDSCEFIRKTTLENEKNQALTLCLRESGQISGMICFHPFDRVANSAGIGYWLDRDSQGKGIITLACDYLIQYGFSHLNLSQISISCGTENRRSRAVPERLGFSRKKIVPQKEWLYDHYVDHCCYEMTAEEWAVLKKSRSMGMSQSHLLFGHDDNARLMIDCNELLIESAAGLSRC